ncbi:class I SAM-dependent methyltransferase [Candidatus Omnitrophota bacterium]
MNSSHTTSQHGNLTEIADERYIRNTLRYVTGEMLDTTGSVLVIGSGDASFENRIRGINSSLNLTSIDFNEEYREKISDISDTVIIDDFLTYRFDRTFDYIVCIDVLEHILDTDTFLKNTHRALAEDGVFYLQTPNLASWHGRLALLFGYTPEPMEVSNVKNYFGKLWFMRDDTPIHHVRIFTYRALREMCSYYGFEVLKAVGVDHRIPFLFRPFPGIAAQICLKLRKKGK